MGKLSSSKIERRSNASSSACRRKSDGIKSRRTKSKKSSRSRRRHDSYSWSSESDYDRSLSSSSYSYSRSEDDYRRNRRSRSFSRKDGRKSKKRVRRYSHSFTSDEGSPPSKIRKESKRKGGGSRSRRKSGRSRYGKDASVGYSSCSICANRSGSEDEYESHRGRSESRESFIEVRDNRSRDRSGSCSSCRQCSRSSCGRDSMFRSEERATDENNSKRLRSVIVVVSAEERKGEEENKEEIVYDEDDYPSSKSNDGNDDESKKDVLDTKGMFESGIGKEVVVSKLHGEPGGAGGNWQDGNQGNSRPSPGTNHEDLETMLRQRALQNLQKLRGIKKAATSHASQEPTVATAEEPELPREDQVNAFGATSRDFSGDLAEKIRIIKEKTVYARQGMVPTGKQSGSAPEGLVRRTVASIPGREFLSAVAPAFSNPRRTAYTWRRESALSQPPAKQLISPQKPEPLQQKPLRTEISTTTSAAENPQTESALNQLPTKNLSSSQRPKQLQADPMVIERTNSASFAESDRNESASNVPPAEEMSVPEIPKPFLAKPMATEMAITASAVMSGRNGNASDQTSLNEVPHQSTDAKSAPGAGSSEKVMDDVEEDPQYEQKRMSVTRGGETIPVNYQVYIPKRTLALARRQLKRDS